MKNPDFVDFSLVVLTQVFVCSARSTDKCTDVRPVGIKADEFDCPDKPGKLIEIVHAMRLRM